MDTKQAKNRLAEAIQELAEARERRRTLRLTADDMSDITDRYQENLEWSWMISDLESEIEDLEKFIIDGENS